MAALPTETAPMDALAAPVRGVRFIQQIRHPGRAYTARRQLSTMKWSNGRDIPSTELDESKRLCQTPRRRQRLARRILGRFIGARGTDGNET